MGFTLVGYVRLVSLFTFWVLFVNNVNIHKNVSAPQAQGAVNMPCTLGAEEKACKII
jgi:hypothetical protein